MNKFCTFLACIFFGSFSAFAQYTETINSNRPGSSQGAFAVGRNVLQLETGARYGHDDHALRNIETNLFGLDYALRYGLAMERLEVNLIGSFLFSNQRMQVGASEEERNFANFESNTLGIKYLVYDPYLKRNLEGPNIKSWDANFKFRWRDLIPAVSVYAGGNILGNDNPYMFPGENSISPKVALITQHNFHTWVLVMNFIADKFGSDYPSYSGIFTLTHSLSRTFAVFAELQIIKSDFYSDDIARGGMAFLLNRNFQVDISALANFKDTPFRWQVALGVSYRLDMHTVNEKIFLDEKTEEKEKNADEKVLENTGIPVKVSDEENQNMENPDQDTNWN